MVLTSTRPGDLVIDPFSGAGTTGVVAVRHGRRYHGIELNQKSVEESLLRIGREGSR